jgi:dihydroxyacetone kinase-like predicted kinase
VKVNGNHLKMAVGETVRLLEKEKEFLNEINVFPVADGDTGTNMYVTLKGTWESILDLKDYRASVIANSIAEASLFHAKGNSGVILSQFFWGFREGVDGKTELGIGDLTTAFVLGARYAYQAVANPVEGTILTVMRETAEWAARFVKSFRDTRSFFIKLFNKGVEVLEKTPELLSKIGKPRVIDSGAYGFTLFLEGFVRAIGGSVSHYQPDKGEKIVREKARSSGPLFCSNFLVRVEDPSILKKIALSYGDSVVVVGSNGTYKVHVHTDKPGEVEDALNKVGTVINRRIERIW